VYLDIGQAAIFQTVTNVLSIYIETRRIDDDGMQPLVVDGISERVLVKPLEDLAIEVRVERYDLNSESLSKTHIALLEFLDSLRWTINLRTAIMKVWHVRTIDKADTPFPGSGPQ
jgi:hypothetical protein